MAQIRNNHIQYVVELNSYELKLIGRGLALMAGLKVSTRGEDRPAAAELNERLLYARLQRVQGEEKIVLDAIRKVEEMKQEEKLSENCSQNPGESGILSM